jgi:hypothetical protein
VTSPSTGAKTKPVLDEGGFQQLLAAAYVLQQHNDSLHAKDPRLDAAWIFSQISETEALVRQGEPDLSQAALMVAERLCKMTSAVSASVCLLKEGSMECVAETGVGARNPGRSIAANSLAATERLRNGRQFQSLDAQADSRLDTELCRELRVRSVLAVPIQRAGQTAGLIEVRWGLPDALHECDVRTSRLMANLLAEILEGQNSEPAGASQSLNSAQTHAEGLSATDEKEALIQNTDELTGPQSDTGHAQQDLASHCRVCGRPFSTDEAFCGNCSMPRVAAKAESDGLQSKWASMWFMQQARETAQERRPVAGKFSLPAPSVPKPPGSRSLPAAPPARHTSGPTYEPVAPAYMARQNNEEIPSAPADSVYAEGRESRREQSMLQILEHEPSPAEGSGSAQYWSAVLNRLRPLFGVRLRVGKRVAAVAVASIIAFVLLATWLSWPAQSKPRLSWFESLLVDLGLAEVQQPRAAPVYAGNPHARVWQDVHTALYYCSDSDLYGKTPGGRFSTQRAAQEDQFEPATRVACQ